MVAEYLNKENETDNRIGTDFVSNKGNAENNENDNQVPNNYYVQMFKDARFPANVIVQDDALNGSKNSRYFNIDLWSKKNGILQLAKPSKSEKNKGCEELPYQKAGGMKGRNDGSFDGKITYNNNHPTVKSITLMSWLIKLVSKENDIVLDPFTGSGTTLIASKILCRKFIGFEKETEYCEIAITD